MKTIASLFFATALVLVGAGVSGCADRDTPRNTPPETTPPGGGTTPPPAPSN